MVSVEAWVEVDGEVLGCAAEGAAVAVESSSFCSELLPLVGVAAAGGGVSAGAGGAAAAAGALAAAEAAGG